MPHLTVSFVPKKDVSLSDIVIEIENMAFATVESLEWTDYPADEGCDDEIGL